MRQHGLIFVFAIMAACKPSVGSPLSLIKGPTVLAVRGEPAEADPKRDQTVTYELLAVDGDGRIPSLDSAVDRPPLWAMCTTPKPPVETNAVSRDCVDGEKLPGQYGFSLTGYSSKMPFDACSLFGPNPPPAKEGEAPVRPRDPDVTGGYYLPIRVSLWIPETQRREGMAGEDTLVAFGFERISCGLANVDGKTSRQFEETYSLNKNPRLSGLKVTSPTESDVRSGSAFHVPQNTTVTFEVSWDDESVESFPAYDIQTRTLQSHRESMVVAWFATGGSFEHESSGRDEADTQTVTSNQWTADGPGHVHLWLVLRDNRGGVDFASYELVVDP